MNNREEILKMLEDGIISVDEAKKLLEAIEKNNNKNELDMSGIGKVSPGEYNKINISGVVSADEEIKSDKIDITGVFNANALVKATTLSIGGVYNANGDLFANVIDVSGVLRAKGTIKCNTIDNSGFLTSNYIEADTVKCTGIIKCDYIKAEAVDINNVTKIRSFLTLDISKVKKIKALKVKLVGVNVEELHIVDGYLENCTINKLHIYNGGEVNIRPSAKVQEVIREDIIL